MIFGALNSIFLLWYKAIFNHFLWYFEISVGKILHAFPTWQVMHMNHAIFFPWQLINLTSEAILMYHNGCRLAASHIVDINLGKSPKSWEKSSSCQAFTYYLYLLGLRNYRPCVAGRKALGFHPFVTRLWGYRTITRGVWTQPVTDTWYGGGQVDRCTSVRRLPIGFHSPCKSFLGSFRCETRPLTTALRGNWSVMIYFCSNIAITK